MRAGQVDLARHDLPRTTGHRRCECLSEGSFSACGRSESAGADTAVAAIWPPLRVYVAVDVQGRSARAGGPAGRRVLHGAANPCAGDRCGGSISINTPLAVVSLAGPSLVTGGIKTGRAGRETFRTALY